MNRLIKIVEVNDIPDEAAYDYMVKRGVSNSIAKRVVKLFGGRFVYMRSSIKLFDFHKCSGLTNL